MLRGCQPVKSFSRIAPRVVALFDRESRSRWKASRARSAMAMKRAENSFRTHQVYPGTKANSTEEDPVAPVNAYGQSKVAAEDYVRGQWHNHYTLRSSIIFGPATAAPRLTQVGRTLFLQARLFFSRLALVVRCLCGSTEAVAGRRPC